MSDETFTREQVSKHNKREDLWVIIDSNVYDLSKFASLHPGGIAALIDEQVAGQDATEAFFSLHRYEVLKRPQYSRLKIGAVARPYNIALKPQTKYYCYNRSIYMHPVIQWV
ncbi:hypothetical protein MPER_09677 [Moniliophthora perniciosa FA553]|nr:hypothetical protein MPER_09677 [Moniliophthora perniciosa FA553]